MWAASLTLVLYFFKATPNSVVISSQRSHFPLLLTILLYLMGEDYLSQFFQWGFQQLILQSILILNYCWKMTTIQFDNLFCKNRKGIQCCDINVQIISNELLESLKCITHIIIHVYNHLSLSVSRQSHLVLQNFFLFLL